MHTIRAYYEDCYTSEFTAEITDTAPDPSGDKLHLYLDTTFFYPESGGQPFDLGRIEGSAVAEVVDQGERIAHVVGLATATRLEPGQSVSCVIDWNRRYDHMQQHTGQHLLSAAFVEMLGYNTLSFHMGERVSTIEIDTGELTPDQISVVEERVNGLVRESRPVSMSYEDAATTTGLRKESQRTGLLRLVTIKDYDRSACGGTHVRSTAELGPIQVRDLQRVRGHVRVEFVCGGRALRASKEDFRTVSQLSRLASVTPDNLQEHFRNIQGRLEAAEKAAQRAAHTLAQAEGSRLYGETAPLADGSRRRVIAVAEWSDSTRALALAFVAHSRAVLLVRPQSLPGTALLAAATDSGVHAGTAWKQAFANGGGRGGGSASLAQGHVTELAGLEQLAALAGILN